MQTGVPANAYFFLICAEILAIQLRDDKKIEVFQIGEFRKLFGQYADNMDVYCKDSDLGEIQKVRSAFCLISGYKINYDKTTLYRIGDATKAIASKYTNVMKNGIEILGVWIEKDVDMMLQKNYEIVLQKSQAVLNSWQVRQLGLHSKVLNINSLVVPKILKK